MDFYNEPLYRKEKKTGRNDPCPCGSGKKYKKCCLDTDEHSPETYITAHEYNFDHKINNQKQFSSNEILELDPFELQILKIDELNPDQLKAAFRKSIISDYHSLAISFIKELRKYYDINNGNLYVEESKIKIMGQFIAIGGEDENFDTLLHELVINIDMKDRKEMVEQVISLYFDQSSFEYNYALLLLSLYRKEPQSILDQMEKLAIAGKEDIENLINLYFTLKKDFPGIALMAFRSIIAAFPNNSFDIVLLINDLDQLEDELSLDTYEILCDYFNEDDDISENTEIIIKMKKELINATKESSRQKKIVEKLKQQQRTIKHPHDNKSPVKKETDTDSFKDQIFQGRKKIEKLQGIIKNKQEAIKELKTQLPFENNISKNKELKDVDKSHEIDFDISAHIISKILIPEYSKEFTKCLESEEPAIARKSLASMTGFTINDTRILKQTKKIKSLDNYYSIRIGIHHRLLVEYKHNRPPKAQYLIHRKDLEKIIKKIQQSQ